MSSRVRQPDISLIAGSDAVEQLKIKDKAYEVELVTRLAEKTEEYMAHIVRRQDEMLVDIADQFREGFKQLKQTSQFQARVKNGSWIEVVIAAQMPQYEDSKKRYLPLMRTWLEDLDKAFVKDFRDDNALFLKHFAELASNDKPFDLADQQELLTQLSVKRETSLKRECDATRAEIMKQLRQIANTALNPIAGLDVKALREIAYASLPKK